MRGGYDPTRPQTTFRTAWRNLVKAAGLKGLRFHDCRHSLRSDLADADVDVQTTMELLGHKSIEASKLYEHSRQSARERREARKREAVLAIEQTAACGDRNGSHVTDTRARPAGRLGAAHGRNVTAAKQHRRESC